MLFELSLTLLGLLLLFEVLRSHRLLSRALKHDTASRALDSYPSVTVIRPIRGLDAGAEQNIEAALDNGYPGPVETLFVLDDETEPALPLIHRAIRQHQASGRPGTARVILCGAPPAGQTGKLNAMIAGLRQASGELIAFADSDIRPDRDALKALVQTLLSRPDAGAAFAPVVASSPHATVGDAGYSLLLNGLYGAAAASATRDNGGELPFIMGQFMVFRRSTIEAIGGLESVEGQLVDDMYIGARVTAAGLRNLVSPQRVPIIQQGLSFGEFAATYRRWILFSRTGLPGWAFKRINVMHGVVFWLGLVAGVTALLSGLWLTAALGFAAPVANSASINALHRNLGGAPLAPRHLWVSFGLILGAPLIYLSIFFKQRVSWRGRSYQLNAQSRLAEGQALEADQPRADRTVQPQGVS